MPVTIDPDCFDPSPPYDPDPGGFVEDDFDPSVLTGHYKSGWEADPQFRVVTDTVERAADALLVAAERFMNVGYSGTEHDDLTTPRGDDDEYTPNSAFVRVDSDAAYLTADTKGWLSHEMAATMKRILVEELTRAEVTALITADYNPIRGYNAESWPLGQE